MTSIQSREIQFKAEKEEEEEEQRLQTIKREKERECVVEKNLYSELLLIIADISDEIGLLTLEARNVRGLCVYSHSSEIVQLREIAE